MLLTNQLFIFENFNKSNLIFCAIFLFGFNFIRADDPSINRGSILVEYWHELSASSIADLKNNPKFPFQPTSSNLLKSFEIPSNQAENYGTRIRGYIFPPETGDYIFWLAADDLGELWLSENENSKSKKLIIEMNDWAGSREWEKFPNQKSKQIHLEKDKKYYIEALHKEVGGGDNLALGWQLPNGSKEMPIPGNRLAPCPIFAEGPGLILAEYWFNVNGGGTKDLTTYVDYPNRPNEYNLLTNFEIPQNQGDNYGTRISRYLLPPESGLYTFWISADDSGELWLGTSKDSTTQKRIAFLYEWTLPNEWEKFPSQKSTKIYLEKDKKYYISALQKEGGFNDHLSVGWQLPNGVKEMPIPGNRLEPCFPPKQLAKTSAVSIKITSPRPTTPGYHCILGKFTYMKKEFDFCTGIYLPEAYFNSKELFPLIATLHNVVGSHGGVTDDREHVTAEGLALLMLKDIGADTRHSGDWPSVRFNPHKEAKFIGLIPQCPKDRGFNSMPMSCVIVEIINWVEKNFRMDPDRVYLTGFSYGGTCTWAVAQQFPERFAAIVPLSARLAPTPEQSPDILQNVGVWSGVGQNDGDFYTSCKQMADIYVKAKHSNFHFTVIKGGAHHCYQSIYGDPELWQWLLAQKRKPINNKEK